MDPTALHHLQALAQQHALDLSNAKIRRTSSRFCLGVEHGDYNGTNLFGVGTDRYIWVAYKANNTNTIRLASGNFPDDGLIAFAGGSYPTPPLTEQQSKSWARFPHGVDFVLRKEGLLQQSVGFDAVVWGNIPGGGMSRFEAASGASRRWRQRRRCRRGGVSAESTPSMPGRHRRAKQQRSVLTSRLGRRERERIGHAQVRVALPQPHRDVARRERGDAPAAGAGQPRAGSRARRAGRERLRRQPLRQPRPDHDLVAAPC